MHYILGILLLIIKIDFPQRKNGFVLDGTVVNSSFNKLYLKYSSLNGETITDSASIINEKFKFFGNLGTSSVVNLFATSQCYNDTCSVSFTIIPTTIEITISNNDLQSIIINDKKTKAEAKLLDSRKHRIVKSRDCAISVCRNYFEMMQKETNMDKKISIKNRYSESEKNLDSIIIEEVKIEIDFIRANPTSFVSLDRLKYRAVKQPEWPAIDSIVNLYNQLSVLVKNSREGKELLSLLTKISNNTIGKQIPYFEIETVDGQKISSVLLKDSAFYLIDFWASWCLPCKEEFPIIKELYNKYALKGFEIISISTDQDRTVFQKSIDKEGISIWKNGQISSKTENLYYPALPTKYLVNKQGIIVGRWRGGGEDNMKSLELMLHKHLN